MTDGRTEDDPVLGRDGQHRDLAVELYEFLDDDARAVAPHLLDCVIPCRSDIAGLITHGSPTSAAATIASSRLSAKRYLEVTSPSSRAANSRIPSRFIV